MRDALQGVNFIVAVAAGSVVVASGIVVFDWLIGGTLDDPRLAVIGFLVSIAVLALMLANIGAIEYRS